MFHPVIPALLITGALVFGGRSALRRRPGEDAIIAQNLAEMLRDARTVISNNQDLINNPELGEKHLTGQAVLARGRQEL